MIKNEKDLIASLRDMSLLPGAPVKQKDGLWRINFPERDVGKKSGQEYSTTNLIAAEKIATKGVLKERDPKFELEKEQRFAANIHGKVLKHSSSLRKGLAETLALLGVHPEGIVILLRRESRKRCLLFRS